MKIAKCGIHPPFSLATPFPVAFCGSFGYLPCPLSEKKGTGTSRTDSVRGVFVIRLGASPLFFAQVWIGTDYEVQRSTRHCACHRPGVCAGRAYFSVLVVEGAELKRFDYAGRGLEGAAAGGRGLVEIASARPYRRPSTGPPTT